MLAIAALSGRASAEGLSLGDLLHRPQPRDVTTPSVARFLDESGRTFTFARETGLPILKYDDDPEIWVLRPTPGPRGDVIYKNDVGQPVLRATWLGGWTVFTPDRPGGMAAALIGQASPPHLPVMLGPQALWQLMTQASARVSRVAQHLVWFDAQEVTPSSESVFAEAVVVTVEAFERVGDKGKGGPKRIARFAGVRFTAGKDPDAVASGKTMEIVVAPQLGPAGHPSSERIAAVLSRR